MAKVYICEGLYHILISICKAKKNDKILILSDNIDDIVNFASRIKKTGIFSEVDLYYQQNDIKGMELLSYCKKNKNDSFYFFYDESNAARIFRKNKIYYNVLEDGYNVFKILKPRFKNFYLRRILNYFNFSAGKGYSNYCLSIEVNEIDGIPIDERKIKFKEYSKKKLFTGLNRNIKEKIKFIYEFSDFSSVGNKNILILTQPLFLDQWDDVIKSEKDQFNYYEKIYQSFVTEYNVFIKPHPRDKIDYSSLKKATIIPKNIPMELFEIFTDHNFDIGITHSSTALDYLSCVKEKIFLKDLKAK